MAFSSRTTRAIHVALGVAAVAGTIGTTTRALAGPTLSALVNLSNGGEVTVNNTLGQSFNVNGTIGADITPFAALGSATLVQTGAVELSTLSSQRLGLNPLLGSTAGSFNRVVGQVSAATVADGVIQFRSLTAVVLLAASGIATVGAAITNTVFGPSNVKATSSFTNQTTTSLTAF